MLVTGSHKPEISQDAQGPGVPSRRHSLLARSFRKLRRTVVLLVILAAVAGLGGFLWFISQISTEEVVLDRNADGIVVLTGGSSRVNDAFELLAAKRGRRLLISGVYPATNPGEISRVMPEYERLFACCVDLDRSAVNTLGNAVATKRWTRQQGFHSLIVVTSAYHMPRALAELSHQLPDVTLVPFPVVAGKLRAEPWWAHMSTARLIFSEYVKYTMSVVRRTVDPNAVTITPSRLSELRRGIGR